MSWKKKERRNPEKMFSIKFKFPRLNTILRGSVAHCVEDLSFDSVSKFLHPLSSRLLLKNIILEPSSNFLTSALWANFVDFCKSGHGSGFIDTLLQSRPRHQQYKSKSESSKS